MDRELEIAGAASAGGWLRWKAHHTQPIGTPCANCQTPIQGPYCHSCGQLAELFERSVWGLLVEGFESFFHFDGRFFGTVPDLVIHPGRLTRHYLDGKRASQIPPFRLFLVVLLIVFFAGGLHFGKDDSKVNVKAATPKEAAAAVKSAVLTPAAKPKSAVDIDVLDDDDAAGSSAAPKDGSRTPAETAAKSKLKSPLGQWIRERVGLAAKNPELFQMILEEWGHRFAILMLPIAALFLSILFVFQRRFYVFDHLIFAMHSLSFQGLLFSVAFLLWQVTSWAGLLWLAAPVHLFLHMRKTYGIGVIGTLLRMFVLFVGSLFAVVMLLSGLVWVGLSLMKAH